MKGKAVTFCSSFEYVHILVLRWARIMSHFIITLGFNVKILNEEIGKMHAINHYNNMPYMQI